MRLPLPLDRGWLASDEPGQFLLRLQLQIGF